MVWAASMASRIERTVHSMLLTTPLRRPRQGTFPTPRMVMPSLSTSPTTALTLVVPRSSPTMISEGGLEVLLVTLGSPVTRQPCAGHRAASRPRRCHVGQNRANFSRSSHPHHDALGVRLVVQEHDAGCSPLG